MCLWWPGFLLLQLFWGRLLEKTQIIMQDFLYNNVETEMQGIPLSHHFYLSGWVFTCIEPADNTTTHILNGIPRSCSTLRTCVLNLLKGISYFRLSYFSAGRLFTARCRRRNLFFGVPEDCSEDIKEDQNYYRPFRFGTENSILTQK